MWEIFSGGGDIISERVQINHRELIEEMYRSTDFYSPNLGEYNLRGSKIKITGGVNMKQQASDRC